MLTKIRRVNISNKRSCCSSSTSDTVFIYGACITGGCILGFFSGANEACEYDKFTDREGIANIFASMILGGAGGGSLGHGFVRIPKITSGMLVVTAFIIFLYLHIPIKS